MVGALFVPLKTTVPMPAVWRSREFAETHVPVPARLVSVRDRASVAVGETLFTFEAPELDSRLRSAETRIEFLKARWARIRASGEGLDQAAVTEEELGGALAERIWITAAGVLMRESGF